MRSHYNHNETAGVPVFHIAGSDCSFMSPLIAGGCDGAVPMHSACGYNVKGNPTSCNGQGTRWRMHSMSSICGGQACDNDHGELKTNQFQHMVMTATP